MALSNSVVKQFAELANANTINKITKKDNTAYGEVVQVDGTNYYAKLDGSDQITPIASTARIKVGDRVIVTLKNHTATVIGNTTDPSASSVEVTEISGAVTQFNTILADKASIGELNASIARIEDLEAEYATIDTLVADIADIEKLFADYATIENLEANYISAKEIESTYATIYDLEANYITARDIEATYATIAKLEADYATIDYLTTHSADIDFANITEAAIAKLGASYANIDFTNIGQAAMEYLYTKSGLIKDVTIESGTITGELIGVTIRGDRIVAGTVEADKLVIKGDDGLYYKLNFEAGTFKDSEVVPTDGLHGSVIVANSITAEKISVSDLVAFDAKIGGFTIGDDSIYSGVKESLDNTTSGIYLNSSGEMNIGDQSNYIKFKDDKLEIAADSIKFAADGKSVQDYATDLVNEEIAGIRIGTQNLIRNSQDLIFSDYYFSGTFIAVYTAETKDIEITCGASAFDDGNGHITVRTSASGTLSGVNLTLA